MTTTNDVGGDERPQRSLQPSPVEGSELSHAEREHYEQLIVAVDAASTVLAEHVDRVLPADAWMDWTKRHRAALCDPPSSPSPAPHVGMGGWLPIETAPTDGRVVIGFDPIDAEDRESPLGGIEFMRMVDGEWRDPETCLMRPTHWLPLPSPPTEGR